MTHTDKLLALAEVLGACDSASYVHNFYCVGLDEALAAYEQWENAE